MEEAALRRTVAKNIAAYRKSHGDTQMDLADKLNYSDKSVSKWERGESLPDICVLTQIASMYGVTVSNLIGEVEPPEQSKPHHHLFVTALSVALVLLIAVCLFTAFELVHVPFRSWLFFLYAIPAAAIVCLVFTCLWWDWFWRGAAITALIWSLVLCVVLSFPEAHLSLLFTVSAALQVIVILWVLFQKSRKKYGHT